MAPRQKRTTTTLPPKRHVATVKKPSATNANVEIIKFRRQQPYRPTEQKSGMWRFHRGNPPKGAKDITPEEWARIFNNAHCSIYDKNGGREGKSGSKARAKGATKAKKFLAPLMKDGTVRDRALTWLVKKGRLDKDYVDEDY